MAGNNNFLDLNNNRENLIRNYFCSGFTYAEICLLLNERHNLQISVPHLKRLLKRLDLRRRNLRFDVENVIYCINKELTESGSSMGYRAMHQKLRSEYNIQVDQETVRICMKQLDPQGVEERSRRTLHRRVYVSRGPNYQWHIDGYDKLRPFGFYIHGCIDGYSRKVMWLEVADSNHDPKLIASYYIKTITAVGGIPKGIRADRGTENVIVAALQRWLHWSVFGDEESHESFKYVRSTSNQRIESWWSFLRRYGGANWWINYFKDLRDSGVYNDSDPIQRACLQFCFMSLIQKELDSIRIRWNAHKIRATRHQECPPGKPDVLYYLPDLQEAENYKINFDSSLLGMVSSLTREKQPFGCETVFAEAFRLLLRENNWHMPSTNDEALELYSNLVTTCTEQVSGD